MQRRKHLSLHGNQRNRSSLVAARVYRRLPRKATIMMAMCQTLSINQVKPPHEQVSDYQQSASTSMDSVHYMSHAVIYDRPSFHMQHVVLHVRVRRWIRIWTAYYRYWTCCCLHVQ